MSHTSKVKVEHKFNNAMQNILKAACDKMQLTLKPWGKHKLYSTTETGFAIQLPGWNYPVVLNEEGIAMDNYNGRWGAQDKLDGLLRRINAEKIIIEARRKGYTVAEKEVEGKIKITLTGGDMDA